MKYKKIVDILKKHGRIVICEGPNEQWITDGGGLYPLSGLPIFDQFTLGKTFDITPEQFDKIIFEHMPEIPAEIDVGDYVDGEIEVEKSPVHIFAQGHRLEPIMTSKGVQFIDQAYLTPFSDIKDDSVRLSERCTPSGKTYFAVKVGMLISGIIMPFDVINETFVKNIDLLARRCRDALNEKYQRAEGESS